MAGIVLAVIITAIIAGIMTRGKKQEGYVFDRNSKIEDEGRQDLSWP